MKKNTKEEFFTAAAVSYGSLKQYDKAINVLRNAAEMYPTKNIYGNMGLYLMEANQNDSSIFYLQKSIQLDSLYFNGWFNLGNAWAKKQDYPKAIQAFNKAVEI